VAEKGYNQARCRLDLLLVERGLAPSREQARGQIMAGRVRVGGVVRDKPGTMVANDSELFLSGPLHPFVSRGGRKLEHALEVFSITVEGAVALDAGASTGGFTHCLLSRGAARVYAVDVGYGQLDWKLRQDPRVVVLERTNARHLGREDIPEPVDLVTIDLSFISVSKVLPAIVPLLAPDGQVVVLVKPQFEVGRGKVGKGGVVRDPELHRQVLLEVAGDAARVGLELWSVSPSPLRGPAGNVEFLIWLRRAGNRPPPADTSELMVNEAIAALVNGTDGGGI